MTAANSQTATCSFTVTVTDNEDPTFQDNTAITLYDQDFENPNITPIQDGCFLDLSLNQGVNPLYGPGWQQKFTVETILINGPQNVPHGSYLAEELRYRACFFGTG
ncbi:MAG: hypothetical protein IPJ00_20785 [Saprospirales bacterium]|nr:hypothetical protein [Saprospirales bacterium]